MKKFLWLLLAFAPYLSGLTTAEVAQQLNYFKYIRDLRAQAEELLDFLNDTRNAEILEYAQQHYDEHALEKKVELGDEYYRFSDQLDRRFQLLDELQVFEGDHLDAIAAPDETKIAFINELRRRAGPYIQKYIEDFKALLNSGGSTLDFVYQ